MSNSGQAKVIEEHWAGDEDILQVIQSVLQGADSAIGAGLWQRIQASRPFSRRR